MNYQSIQNSGADVKSYTQLVIVILGAYGDLQQTLSEEKIEVSLANAIQELALLPLYVSFIKGLDSPEVLESIFNRLDAVQVPSEINESFLRALRGLELKLETRKSAQSLKQNFCKYFRYQRDKCGTEMPTLASDARTSISDRASQLVWLDEYRSSVEPVLAASLKQDQLSELTEQMGAIVSELRHLAIQSAVRKDVERRRLFSDLLSMP